MDRILSSEEQAVLVKDLLEKRQGHELQKQRLLENILAEKQLIVKNNEIESRDKVKALNELRLELRRKEEEIVKQKAIHEEFRGKGLEYMVEVALGNGPDMEDLIGDYE